MYLSSTPWKQKRISHILNTIPEPLFMWSRFLPRLHTYMYYALTCTYSIHHKHDTYEEEVIFPSLKSLFFFLWDSLTTRMKCVYNFHYMKCTFMHFVTRRYFVRLVIAFHVSVFHVGSAYTPNWFFLFSFSLILHRNTKCISCKCISCGVQLTRTKYFRDIYTHTKYFTWNTLCVCV